MKEPFLGVPKGSVRVENPDGVYLGRPDRHNLYDRTTVAQPVIPGDADRETPVGRTRTDPKV